RMGGVSLLESSQYPCKPANRSFLIHRILRRPEKHAQLAVDDLRDLAPDRLGCRDDALHLRFDVIGEDEAHDLAEIDAQVFYPWTIGHGKICGDPYQELMQSQPLRAECRHVGELEAGEITELARVIQAGEDILRPKDRA